MVNLVFDYDGTLHDCMKIYAPAFRRMYDHMVSQGWAEDRTFTDRDISRWLGFPAKEMWEGFAPHLAPEKQAVCSRMIGEHMLAQIAQGHARLYPGIPEVLFQLKESGFRLIFLSNCKHAYMQAHREHFQLDRFFSGFYCGEDHGWKRKVEIFLTIKQHFDGDFVIIGDRLQDMEIAQQHNLPAIGCGYGYGTPEELSKANYIARSPNELVEFAKIVCSK